MHPAAVVAMGFRYPSPGAAVELMTAIGDATSGAVERHLARFAAEVSALPLGEWEERHTATLDLSPQFVPYVGHITWGDNYRRGEFMADLKVDMSRWGVELHGELPDHIEPILRYLATTPEPLPDLIEVLPASVATMRETLDGASPHNPYRHLLSATAAVIAECAVVSIGATQ